MPAPAPPSGLTPNTRDRIPVNGPQAQVTLTWQPVAGATFYAVRVNDNTAPLLRYPHNNCPGDPHFLCVNSLSATSISFQARAGHDYTWWVHAVNEAGWSAPAVAGFRLGEPPADPNYKPGPLRFYMATPPYREILRPTPSTWKASLYINRDALNERMNFTVKAELHNAVDAVVATAETLLPGGTPTGVRDGALTMSTPALTSGSYRWRFSLLGPAGGLRDSKEIELRVVDTEPKVYIKEGPKLIRMGVPLMPVGMYDYDSEGEDHLSHLASFGFNAIINYTFGHFSYEGDAAYAIQLARNYMDTAMRYGIGVIYNLASFYKEHREFPPVDKTGLELATEYINAIRDHPALLAWYIADEPMQPDRIPHILSLYQLVRDLDPQHPAVIVQHNPSEALLDALYNATDIIGVDPYPIPGNDLTLVTDWTTIAQHSARHVKPAWTVTQAFAGQVYYPDAPQDAREPTLAEKRCMVYLALAAQARGLMLYSYADQFKELIIDPITGQPVVVSPPADPTLLPRRLSELSAIGTEIQSLAPKLVAGQERPLGTQGAGEIRARAVEYGRFLWVLLANPSESKLTVNLGLPTGKWGLVEAPYGTVSGTLLSTSKLQVTVPALNGGYLRVSRVRAGESLNE